MFFFLFFFLFERRLAELFFIKLNYFYPCRYELDILTEPLVTALDDGEGDFEVIQVVPIVPELTGRLNWSHI